MPNPPTILISAYAINPYKGSEDGSGWNFAYQIARSNRIILVTRKNNRQHIEKFFSEFPDDVYANMDCRYFDWPTWTLFWKKGPILSLIYFYFWQLSLALHIKKNRWQFDIAHNLNFHNDWTPSFLWIFKKPLVWGPIGHHPKIPAVFLKYYGWKSFFSDRLLWALKNIFWHTDPFLALTKKKATHVFCMNTSVIERLPSIRKKYSILPSAIINDSNTSLKTANKTIEQPFIFLSIGRFVPLKGFDITIESFACFYHALTEEHKQRVQLKIIGKGLYEQKLRKLAVDLGVEKSITFIPWMNRDALQQLYLESSAFLFPSFEGAGMVVVEALSYALPVICWNNSGPGEFVDPQTQLKVNLVNSRAQAVDLFAEKMSMVYNHPDLLAKESELARKRFEHSFTWNTQRVKIYDVYSGIMNQ